MERTYSVISEGQKMVSKLIERYPDVLWQVREEQIAVLGIDNKEPTKRSKDCTVRSLKNAEKAICQMHKVKTRYILEFWWARWNLWNTTRKEWAILNALMRVSVDEGKLLNPDSVEFRIILDQVGFDWHVEGANLPSLTSGNPIEFDLDLRPGLDIDEEESDVIPPPPGSSGQVVVTSTASSAALDLNSDSESDSEDVFEEEGEDVD